MGFDNECIANIQSLPGEYFCPVCRTLANPNEALQAQCTHLYCKPCLAYVVATTRACPYDGYLVVEANAKPLMESNKSIAEAIGKVAVQCLFQRSGCTWQGTLTDCITHCTDCSFGNSPVVCNRCGTQIIHRLVQEHAQNCPGLQPQLQQVENSQAQTTSVQNQATAQDPSTVPTSAVETNAASNTTTAAVPAAPAPGPTAPISAPVPAHGQMQQGTQSMTPEQWYQQQQLQYQQYYQQYAGYDPYQQQYQQYAQYQQQAYQNYPQSYGQGPTQVAGQGQQPPAQYMQAQPPQPQLPSQPQSQPVVQAIPPQTQLSMQLQPQQPQLTQPHPQSQPQLQGAQQYQHAHLQPMQPQPSVLTQQLPPSQPQIHPAPNALPQQAHQAHHPPAQGHPLSQPQQVQSQPHLPPHQSMPSQQHPQPIMQQIQPPSQHPAQMPAQHQLQQPIQHQSHPLPQPRPTQQAQPSHPGHQSYPPTYPPQQLPTGMPQRPMQVPPQPTMHHQPSQQHIQMHNQFPSQQAAQMHPPSNPLPMQNPQHHQGPRSGGPPIQQQPPHPVQGSGQQYQLHAGMQPSMQQHHLPQQQVSGQQAFQQGAASAHQPIHPPQSMRPPSSQIQHAFPVQMPVHQSQAIASRSIPLNQGLPQHPFQQSQQSYIGKTAPHTATLDGQPDSFGALATSLAASHQPSGYQGNPIPDNAAEGPVLPVDTVQNHDEVTEREELKIPLSEPAPMSAVGDGKAASLNEEDGLTNNDSKVTKDSSPMDGKIPEENVEGSEVKQSTGENGVKEGEQFGAEQGDKELPFKECLLSKKSGEMSDQKDTNQLPDRKETLGSISQNLNANNNVPVSDASTELNAPDRGPTQRQTIHDNSFSQPSFQGASFSQSNQQSRVPDRLQGMPPSGHFPSQERPPHNVPFGHNVNVTDPAMAFQRPPLADTAHQHVSMQARFHGPSHHGPLPMLPQPPGEFRPQVNQFSQNTSYQGHAPGGSEPFQPPHGRGSFGSMHPEFPHPGIPGPTARAPLGSHDQQSGPSARPPMHGSPAGTYETPNGMISRGSPFFQDQAGQFRPTNFSEVGRRPDMHQLVQSGQPPFGQPYSLKPNSFPGNAPFGGIHDSATSHGFVAERSRPSPEDNFRPAAMDPRNHIERQREFEEDLKQFPRPDILDRDIVSRFDGNLHSRPFEKGPHPYSSSARPFDRASNRPEGDFDPANTRPLRPYQAFGSLPDNIIGSPNFEMDSRERNRAVVFHDDAGRRSDSIWHPHGPESGHHRGDPLRSPQREFDRPPLSKIGRGVQSHVEDHVPHGFHDLSKAADPNLVPFGSSFRDGRFGRPVAPGSDPFPIHYNRSASGITDIVPSHPQGVDPFLHHGLPGYLRGELAGFDTLRIERRMNEPGFGGNFPSHHIGDSGEPRFGGYPSHGFHNEDRFSSFPPLGGFDSFELSRKRRFGSMGWCRICMIDCETVEGLEIHSQTKEHQSTAMDMVRTIKEENSRKRKQPLDDHISVEDVNKAKKSSVEMRGDRC